MIKARNISRKIQSGAVTLCVMAAGLMAAQAQDTPIGGANQYGQKSDTTINNTAGQPQNVNRCSKLVGAIVENQQGDKLGKIDDVVVDLQNGRVSYCVLDVEHGIFAKGKYLAVPLAAFQPNADGTRLILNAGKDKVAQAEGFDRNSWPSVSNPAWGAQPFWQTTTPNQSITPSGSSSSTSSHYSSENKDATGRP